MGVVVSPEQFFAAPSSSSFSSAPEWIFPWATHLKDNSSPTQVSHGHSSSREYVTTLGGFFDTDCSEISAPLWCFPWAASNPYSDAWSTSSTALFLTLVLARFLLTLFFFLLLSPHCHTTFSPFLKSVSHRHYYLGCWVGWTDLKLQPA